VLNQEIIMQNGKQIIDRAPFSRAGEVVVSASSKNVALPDKASTHNMDREFEVPFVTFKLTALAEGAVVDPQPNVLDRLIKIRALDANRASLIGDSLPLTVVGNSVYRWTPPKPLLFRRGDGWQFTFDGRESFDIAYDGKRKRIDEIRVEVTFEGELLTYAYGVTAEATAPDVETPRA
jgi:hypothetical protein